MRTALIMALTALMAVPAAAQQACNRELIEMIDYSITPVDEDTNRLITTFRSNAASTIRMIDASAGFIDALGGTIATFAMDRDISVPPGESFEQEGLWGPHTFERLLDLKKDEVERFVCVRAVLYDDGSKEEF